MEVQLYVGYISGSRYFRWSSGCRWGISIVHVASLPLTCQRDMRYPLFVAALLLSGVAACDLGNVEDDWRPPAGYATIEGVVSDTSGTPLPDVMVLSNLCVFSEQSFIEQSFLLGDSLSLSPSRTWTNDKGHFDLNQSLPPVGAFPAYEGEMLEAECALFVGKDVETLLGRATGTVIFHRDKEQRRASTIDVTVEE